mmetsp:Transcript_13056/g.33326  ORF Transcript_13056/g.33326 Transcript_13056/m.33326 type:complete len:287 (-) Transcript_13056:252-1112(-)
MPPVHAGVVREAQKPCHCVHDGDGVPRQPVRVARHLAAQEGGPGAAVPRQRRHRARQHVRAGGHQDVRGALQHQVPHVRPAGVAQPGRGVPGRLARRHHRGRPPHRGQVPLLPHADRGRAALLRVPGAVPHAHAAAAGLRLHPVRAVEDLPAGDLHRHAHRVRPRLLVQALPGAAVLLGRRPARPRGQDRAPRPAHGRGQAGVGGARGGQRGRRPPRLGDLRRAAPAEPRQRAHLQRPRGPPRAAGGGRRLRGRGGRQRGGRSLGPRPRPVGVAPGRRSRSRVPVP